MTPLTLLAPDGVRRSDLIQVVVRLDDRPETDLPPRLPPP